jgi:hypothetical protein
MTRITTTLRTVLQYSLARLRVLCTTRLGWSLLLVSTSLVLAVMGTSAAWRARTSGEEPRPVEPTFAVSPLAEVEPKTSDMTSSQQASASPLPPPLMSLPTATNSTATVLSDAVRDPFTNITIDDDQAEQASHQPVRAPQPALTRRDVGVTMAERCNTGARVRHNAQTVTQPRRPTRVPSSAPVPRVHVLSVSSTAALIHYDGWRQIVHRGAPLQGWMVVRLAPTGVTVRRAKQIAFLPLAFGTRSAVTR